MHHSLRIGLNFLAAVSTCKGFDGLRDSLAGWPQEERELLHSYQWVENHHRLQPAQSPNSLEHVIQSLPLSPSDPPPAHSFHSRQPGSVANLPSDHPYLNLPPADPSVHPGTAFAPNFQFHPGLHQDRGEPEAFAVSEAPWPLEDSSGQQANLAHPDQEQTAWEEFLHGSPIPFPISPNVEEGQVDLLAPFKDSLDFEYFLDHYPNLLTSPATDHPPAKTLVPDAPSRLPQPSETFEPLKLTQPALGAFENFPSHQNEHSRADWRLYNTATPSLADVPSQLKWDYIQRASEHSYAQGTLDNPAHDGNTVWNPLPQSSESTINSDRQHLQSHPLPSSFLPAPAPFDEPPRLNTVAWEGPHQSYQTELHNFAAYPHSVWSPHIPSHLSLHPVGPEPVRDPEPWPLVHSSRQEASHNADQHATSRIPTAPESTSNSNHQLSRGSDGVTVLKSGTRRRKSPEPPVQLSAQPPASPLSHGLPIQLFTKTDFEQKDPKLVIQFSPRSSNDLLFFDEKQLLTFCHESPMMHHGPEVSAFRQQLLVDSVRAFLPHMKTWLLYWHSRTKVDPRYYLSQVRWGEAEPLFPLFLMYVELITAFLREPNPRGYAEEFRLRCELFVAVANEMEPNKPSSTSSVEAQGPTNPSDTKDMKTPKATRELKNQPSRYMGAVWKLIFCWAYNYRSALLDINRFDEPIIPKCLKTLINFVFTASAHKLTKLTSQLVGLPETSAPKRTKY